MDRVFVEKMRKTVVIPVRFNVKNRQFKKNSTGD